MGGRMSQCTKEVIQPEVKETLREGVVSLECLENKTVKRPCPYGDNTVEREGENNYEAYQGNFLVCTKH